MLPHAHVTTTAQKKGSSKKPFSCAVTVFLSVCHKNRRKHSSGASGWKGAKNVTFTELPYKRSSKKSICLSPFPRMNLTRLSFLLLPKSHSLQRLETYGGICDSCNKSNSMIHLFDSFAPFDHFAITHDFKHLPAHKTPKYSRALPCTRMPIHACPANANPFRIYRNIKSPTIKAKLPIECRKKK